MFVKFRQMLDVPTSYRAYRPKARTKKSSSPIPSVPPEILSRKQQLEEKGISPLLKYHKESNSYFLQYNSEMSVKWNSSRSAADVWKEAIGL
ncbi:MAG: hypothetical protein EF806_00270 [Candidatus Methanoliparum thermophilum]|uniref:Uncharacterized protein n=1 Tax=Methanoliparum thermophilum TaxID=2491083 RepID=A0A520KUJ0_METT2|nr:hypothetical protein [Candidatus Methanoliparum sp. LAM-1]RZN65371.1 MAG: hypothetical protein EF806_00270 [Candidatus Methanoliparum thermophilum]BDC35543.1 hypothetical protein MTLP_02250 [Candidatus Methanoliparum sp. LAM-1]